MHYSPSLRGFYCPEVNGVLPVDAIPISADLYADLLAGQAIGQQIVPGEDGIPHLVDPPVDEAGLADQIRMRRTSLLRDSDWTQLPDLPLSEGAALLWRTYRQALRDVPAQPGFPGSVIWPESPSG